MKRESDVLPGSHCRRLLRRIVIVCINLTLVYSRTNIVILNELDTKLRLLAIVRENEISRTCHQTQAMRHHEKIVHGTLEGKIKRVRPIITYINLTTWNKWSEMTNI